MNWKYETWRKLYTREEGTFASLSYSARSLAAMLLKLCDEKGRVNARAKETIEDAIFMRFRVDRGERRLVREALAELVADGYLVRGETWIRIKNYHLAQGRSGADEVPDVTVSPSVRDGAANDTRPVREGDVTVSPSDRDDDVTVSRPRIEDQAKCPEPLKTDPDVPSVPDLPSVPKPEGTLTGARDPGAGATEPERPFPLSLAKPSRPTAYQVKDRWGRIRAEIFPCYMPWDVPGDNRGETASWLAGLSDEAIADLDPAMRLALANMRDGVRDWDNPTLHKDPAFGFGALRSRLTALREHLHGRVVTTRPPARASPPPPQPGLCAFHQPASTANRRAPKHDPECSECRHVAAKDRPRTETEPEPAFGGVR